MFEGHGGICRAVVITGPGMGGTFLHYYCFPLAACLGTTSCPLPHCLVTPHCGTLALSLSPCRQLCSWGYGKKVIAEQEGTLPCSLVMPLFKFAMVWGRNRFEPLGPTPKPAGAPGNEQLLLF